MTNSCQNCIHNVIIIIHLNVHAKECDLRYHYYQMGESLILQHDGGRERAEKTLIQTNISEVKCLHLFLPASITANIALGWFWFEFEEGVLSR